jgi:hypothetical protein
LTSEPNLGRLGFICISIIDNNYMILKFLSLLYRTFDLVLGQTHFIHHLIVGGTECVCIVDGIYNGLQQTSATFALVLLSSVCYKSRVYSINHSLVI